MKRTAAVFALAMLVAAGSIAGESKDPLLEESVGKRTFVLAEFVSRTCPVCREMGPLVEAAVARHRNVSHQVHDADKEADLAAKYKVRCVPVYVVVDPKGAVRFNDVGTRTAEELDEILGKAGAQRR